MDWIKKNRTLAQLLLILLVIGGVGIFFWLQETQRVKTTREELESQQLTLERLKGQAVFPDETNEKVYESRAKDLETYLNPVIASLEKGAIQGEALNPINFQTEFRDTRDRLIARAQKVKPAIVLPENFSFGFDKYLTSIPAPEATLYLTQQLRIIERLTELLFSANIIELRNIARVPVEDLLKQTAAGPVARPVERRSVAGESSELLPAISLDREDLHYRTFPFVFQFVATDTGLRKIVNALSDESKKKEKAAFFVLRSLEVVNERGAPPTVENLKASATSAEGVKSVAANLILGEETIRATMRVDYIEWKKEEKTEKKRNK